MGVCWYCHWGWPTQVAAIYDRYVAIAGEGSMHYGPAHVVWEDENFERDSVQWCLDHFSEHLRTESTPEQMAAVRQSLEDLLKLPDSVLDAIPSDYDDEHPDQYPPSAELTMAHR